MVGVARGGIEPAPERPFHGEEDVTAQPVPVEAVEVGVERVGGGVLVGIAVVGGGIGADGKTEGIVTPAGDVVQRHRGAMRGGVEPGVPAGEFSPRTIRALDREAAEQHAKPGNGNGFASREIVAQGVEKERIGLKYRRDAHLQVRRAGHAAEEEQEEKNAEFHDVARGYSTV